MEKTQSQKAKTFLKIGVKDSIIDSELARGCEQLIQQLSRRSHAQALKLAEDYEMRTRSAGRLLRLSAQRTLARMAHLSGLHRRALEAYLKARRLIRSDPLLRGRIDRALIDVHMYLGQYSKACQAAQKAIKTFTNLGCEADLAQTKVNYANLLHRQDCHRDAERYYRQAGDFFRRNGPAVAAARCYYNQANTLVQLFEMRQAEKLYREAEKINEAEGFSLDANDARYGLAWLKMLVGDYHLALLELADCEQIYREGGDPRGEALCVLDRAEVYLSLGLYKDALKAAGVSERRFRKLNSRYEMAKAALFKGQAAWALGRKSQALRALKKAKTDFIREQNEGFVGVTRLFAASLSRGSARKRRQEVEAAKRMFSRVQLPLWEAICDLYLLSESSDHRRILKNLAQNRAVRLVPHLYACWQTACGDFELSQGRRAAAIHCWQQAADRLDVVRAKLPPLELRSTFHRKSDSPHRRLIAAELDGNSLAAAVWAERYRTSGLWSTTAIDRTVLPVRNKIRENLEDLAGRVAALSHYLGGKQGKRGLSSGKRFRALSGIQKEVRDSFIALETLMSRESSVPTGLAQAFENTSHVLPIVQFHILEDDIIAFIHDQGNTRTKRIIGGQIRLTRAMDCWRFILEGILLSDYFRSPDYDNAETTLWTDLGEWLWKPLEISSKHQKILILPEGELANLPWSALIINKQLLMHTHQVIIAPSLRHYLAAKSRKPRSGKVEIFQGAMDWLSRDDSELKLIGQKSGRDAIFHHSARRENWPDSGSAFIWHFTGHAELRVDNPFYSYLAMNDGPLFAADFRLKNCLVDLVTLAACSSGRQVALPGEETTGLVRSLLEMGAKNVISSYWPVSDKATSIWMKKFYSDFLGNKSILDSIQNASNTVREIFPSAYYWAAFSVSGAGERGGSYATSDNRHR